MIEIKRKLKNFGPLEFLVISSIVYVVTMLIWTASTRTEVVEQSKNKMDYKKEQELAKTVDEVKERVMNLDTKGISKGAENENS